MEENEMGARWTNTFPIPHPALVTIPHQRYGVMAHRLRGVQRGEERWGRGSCGSHFVKQPGNRQGCSFRRLIAGNQIHPTADLKSLKLPALENNCYDFFLIFALSVIKCVETTDHFIKHVYSPTGSWSLSLGKAPIIVGGLLLWRKDKSQHESMGFSAAAVAAIFMHGFVLWFRLLQVMRCVFVSFCAILVQKKVFQMTTCVQGIMFL